MVPVFKRGRKEDPENDLTSIPGKIVEQIFLEDVLRHTENREVDVGQPAQPHQAQVLPDPPSGLL